MITNNHYHQQQHQQQQQQQPETLSHHPSSSAGFGTRARTGNRPPDDGGWSCGIPEKGSGWRNSTTPGGSGTAGGGVSGWGGSSAESAEAAGTLGWGDGGGGGGTNGLEKPKSWFPSDTTAPNRPSSIGTDGWGGKSPRGGRGGEKTAWGGNKSNLTPASQGPLSSLDPPDQKRSYESGMNGMSVWGKTPTSDTGVGSNWKHTPSLENNSQGEIATPGGTYSPPQQQGDEVGWRMKQQDPGDASMGGEQLRDTRGHSQESYRPLTTSPAGFGSQHQQQLDNLSLGSSGSNSRTNDYSQLSGNFSHDGHMTGSDDTGAHPTGGGGYESPYSRISPRNGAGTPTTIQPPRSGGATPIQGAGGKGDVGESSWAAAGRGSTSSMNSVGSSSSWKGEGRNGSAGGGGRSGSPRKLSR